MVDVFISYSRTNKEKVARLARAIEAEGYAVWWDAELPPHQSYGEVITAKIESAKAALVVWSPEASASEWVRAEADAARNQKKLIQTSLSDITPPLPFNQIQCANLSDWNGEADHPGWSKVKVSLKALCGEGAEAPTPAAMPAAAAAATMSPPPPVQSGPRNNTWPIFAGLGVAVVGLIGAASMVFGDSAQPDNTASTLLTADLTEGSVSDTTPAEVDAGKPSDAAIDSPRIDAPSVAPVTQPVVPADNYGAAPQVDAYNREVALTNASGQTIMYLFWSSTQDENWGDDRLGSDVFPKGEQWFVTVDDGTNACNFDFMARLADGSEIVRSDINVCSVWEISFN